MMKSNSRLGEALRAGRLAVTAECLPPVSGDASAVKKISAALPANLDAVVVADNPDGIHCSALACAAILAGEGRPTVLSMVTRDRNRIALQSGVLGAAALGIEAVLCLSGDHQSLDICPQAAGAYDIDSIQFVQAVKKLGEDGSGFNGHKVDPLPKLAVGAVAHPYQQPMDLSLLRLRKKIAAGADFVLTQAVFDVAGFSRWMEAAQSAGLAEKVAIVASVLPLTSVEQARAMQRRGTYGPITDAVIDRLAKTADPAQEGVAMAAAAAGQLKSIAGVRGIHILSGGCEALASAVIQKAGLA
jgi:methylenetetrahydrofolate reductase (NADPH)